MRSDFDFAPFYRATVGFDRVFDMLDTNGSIPGYLPVKAPPPASRGLNYDVLS